MPFSIIEWYKHLASLVKEKGMSNSERFKVVVNSWEDIDQEVGIIVGIITDGVMPSNVRLHAAVSKLADIKFSGHEWNAFDCKDFRATVYDVFQAKFDDSACDYAFRIHIVTLVVEGVFKHYSGRFASLRETSACIDRLRGFLTLHELSSFEAYQKAKSKSKGEVEMSTINVGQVSSSRDFSQPAVKMVTRVFGTDVDNLTDCNLIGMIADMESEIKILDQIEAKPKKLVAKIKAIQDNIKAIVKIIDERP